MNKFNNLYQKIVSQENNNVIKQGWKKNLATLASVGVLGATPHMNDIYFSTDDDYQVNNHYKQQQKIQKKIQNKKQNKIQNNSEMCIEAQMLELNKNVSNSKQNTTKIALQFIKQYQGTKKDKNGNCIVFDDLSDKTWNKSNKSFEQFKKSCVGKPTIGYGETKQSIVKKGKISQAEAINLLKQRIEEFYTKLSDEGGVVFDQQMTAFQKAALISLYYNIGIKGQFENTPKLFDAIQYEDFITIAKEFLDCNKITKNGKKIQVKGLTNRRKAQYNLYFTGLKI